MITLTNQQVFRLEAVSKSILTFVGGCFDEDTKIFIARAEDGRTFDIQLSDEDTMLVLEGIKISRD